jgi:hypothetical protein
VKGPGNFTLKASPHSAGRDQVGDVAALAWIIPGPVKCPTSTIEGLSVQASYNLGPRIFRVDCSIYLVYWVLLLQGKRTSRLRRGYKAIIVKCVLGMKLRKVG